MSLKINAAQLNRIRANARTLTIQVRARKLTSALKDAAKPMRDEARNRTPVKTGVSRRSLNWRKEIKGGFTGIRLVGDFKFNFLERGTVPRKRKNGGFTGTLRAYNIQRGAFDKTHPQVTERFANSLERKIDLAVR